jgi:hypothetical protein
MQNLGEDRIHAERGHTERTKSLNRSERTEEMQNFREDKTQAKRGHTERTKS